MPASCCKPEQQAAGRILVIGVFLDDFSVRSDLTDFLFADVSFDHSAKGVATELELSIRQLAADFCE
jgi:hypothetical protein